MTKREEKILETFYLLWKEGKMPSAGELSDQYKLDHPEWGAAINRLISHGYLEKVKDKEELKLTDLGKARAAESQACHQYLTEFLQITCGVGEEKAQENACRMEHVIRQRDHGWRTGIFKIWGYLRPYGTDWDSRKQVSGTQTDKQVLQKRMEEAQGYLSGLAEDAQGYSQNRIHMLEAAATASAAAAECHC